MMKHGELTEKSSLNETIKDSLKDYEARFLEQE